MPNEFERVCRDLSGVAVVLPGSFENKARSEILKACGSLAGKAKAKAQDLEHAARGEFGMISAETLKQLKNLAKEQGKKHSSKLPKFKMKAVQKPTKGKGKQLRVKIPGTYAGLDVHVLVNIDDEKIWDANLDVIGSGVGVSRKFGDKVSVDARYFRGTSEAQTTHGGSILVIYSF